MEDSSNTSWGHADSELKSRWNKFSVRPVNLAQRSRLWAGYVALLLAGFPALAQPSSAEQPFAQRFDTIGHPKALGARVAVRFPTGWKAQESSRPKTVQNFTGEYAGVPAVLSLAVEAQEDTFEATCAQATREMWIQGSSPTHWDSIDARVVSWKGKPGAIVETGKSGKQGNFQVRSMSRSLLVCQGRYLIKAVCATSVVDAAEANMQKVSRLCERYFDSLDFN
jgi:hypothetical protein